MCRTVVPPVNPPQPLVVAHRLLCGMFIFFPSRARRSVPRQVWSGAASTGVGHAILKNPQIAACRSTRLRSPRHERQYRRGHPAESGSTAATPPGRPPDYSNALVKRAWPFMGRNPGLTCPFGRYQWILRIAGYAILVQRSRAQPELSDRCPIVLDCGIHPRSPADQNRDR